MASPVYLASTGATRGFSADETGIKIETFDQSFNSPRDYLLDKNGGAADVAVNFDPRRTVTISGDVLSATGLLSTDCNFAEEFSSHLVQADTLTAYQTAGGATPWTGALFLTEGSISEGREQWKATSASFEAIPGIGTA